MIEIIGNINFNDIDFSKYKREIDEINNWIDELKKNKLLIKKIKEGGRMNVITIYELLGLIKEGKAPKRIKCNDIEYECYEDKEKIDYSFIDEENGMRGWLSTIIGDNYITDLFKIEIEIIEEKKEIEKINYYPIRKNEIAVDYIENNETKHFCLNKKEKYFVDKINELVRELNELKNK